MCTFAVIRSTTASCACNAMIGRKCVPVCGYGDVVNGCAFAFSDSGARVFLVDCVLHTVESVVSEMQVDMAGLEGLEGMTVDNSKLCGSFRLPCWSRCDRVGFKADVQFLGCDTGHPSLVLASSLQERCLPLAEKSATGKWEIAPLKH